MEEMDDYDIESAHESSEAFDRAHPEAKMQKNYQVKEVMSEMKESKGKRAKKNARPGSVPPTGKKKTMFDKYSGVFLGGPDEF